MERQLSNPLLKRTRNLVGALGNSMKNMNHANASIEEKHQDDGLLEEWPSEPTRVTKDETRSKNTATLLEDWSHNVEAYGNIDVDLLKCAVKDANSYRKSLVQKDELDITLRSYTVSEKYRKKEGQITDDGLAETSAASNDMLEDWPSSSSICSGDNETNETGIIRRNSLDFECVNKSLRALNIPSNDDKNKNSEFTIPHKSDQNHTGMDKYGTYSRASSSTRLLSIDIL